MATISTRPAEPFSLITSIRLDDYPGFQEHTCVMIAATMAEFHNILIRSLNSVYKSSEGVKSGTRDAADLLLYGQFLCDMIEVHHSWEETSYFPALEKFAGQRGILESNVEQHHAFEKGLQTLHEYCQIPTERFSTQKLQGLIEDIAPALNKHLHEEPLSFYRLRHLDSSGLRKVYEEQKEIARAKGDIWR
jgi:hemerythrin-like domain-containing protein